MDSSDVFRFEPGINTFGGKGYQGKDGSNGRIIRYVPYVIAGDDSVTFKKTFSRNDRYHGDSFEDSSICTTNDILIDSAGWIYKIMNVYEDKVDVSMCGSIFNNIYVGVDESNTYLYNGDEQTIHPDVSYVISENEYNFIGSSSIEDFVDASIENLYFDAIDKYACMIKISINHGNSDSIKNGKIVITMNDGTYIEKNVVPDGDSSVCALFDARYFTMIDASMFDASFTGRNFNNYQNYKKYFSPDAQQAETDSSYKDIVKNNSGCRIYIEYEYNGKTYRVKIKG